MKEKTFLKQCASFLAVLCFAILLAPGFAKAKRVEDPSEIGELSYWSSLPGLAFDKTEAEAKAKELYPNGLGLFTQTLKGETTLDGGAYPPLNFGFTLKVVEGSPLIGQTPDNALRILSFKSADLENPKPIPFDSAGSLNTYKIVPDLSDGVFAEGNYELTMKIENNGPFDDDAPDTKDTVLNLVILAWAGAPDAISTTQAAAAGDGFDYYSIKATAPEVNESDPAYTLDPADETKEVNFVQTVSMTAGLANDGSALNNNEVLILKMPYKPKFLPESKTFKDVKLESVPAEAVEYVRVEEDVENLEAGEWAAFLPDFALEKGNAQTENANVASNMSYDIYYAVAVNDASSFTNTTRIIGPESFPEPSPADGAAFVSERQEDETLAGNEALILLKAGTTLTPNASVDIKGIPSHFVAQNEGKSIALTTDATTVFPADPTQTKPSFVTYFVKFTVPDYKSNTDLIDLAPTLADLYVQHVDSEGALGEKLSFWAENEGPAANKYWVKDSNGDPFTDTEATLLAGEYTMFYTIGIDQESKKATSNVAVLTKTAEVEKTISTQTVPTVLPETGLDEGVQPGLPNATELTWAYHPRSIQDFEIQVGITANKDSIDLGAQEFEFSASGLTADSVYIAQRTFTYIGEPLPINSDNILLRKFKDNNSTNLDFTLYNGKPDLTSQAFLGDMDGKFWLQESGQTDYIDTSQDNNFTSGTSYIVYFGIKNNGEYDANEALDSIKDPNFLNTGSGVGPGNSSNSSSSGCSVGATSAYDMALLALFALGLVALRMRSRKS